MGTLLALTLAVIAAVAHIYLAMAAGNFFLRLFRKPTTATPRWVDLDPGAYRFEDGRFTYEGSRPVSELFR